MSNKHLPPNKTATLSLVAQDKVLRLFNQLRHLLAPSTEYDIPVWLQHYLTHFINKLINDLRNITQNHAKYQSIDTTPAQKSADVGFNQIQDSLQQVCDQLTRQLHQLQQIYVNPPARDNSDIEEIIRTVISQLPSIQQKDVEWRNTEDFQVTVPRFFFQCLLINVIEACQQACISTDTGTVELWTEQILPFNQLHLLCSAALDFHDNEDSQFGNFDVMCFHLSLKACESLLSSINGTIEIHPNSEHKGVYVILSFPSNTKSDG